MLNTVSITDLKQNTSKIIKKVKEEEKNLVVLQRSKAVAVLVDPEYYEVLESALEDKLDLKSIEDRKDEDTVSIDEIAKKLNMA